MKLFLLTLAAVALCVLLLSVRLFFGRAFVQTHVGGNKLMRRRGIGCVQTQDAQARSKRRKGVREREERIQSSHNDSL